MKIVSKNLFINILGSVLPILIVLVCVPGYIKVIGLDMFGLLSLIWLVFGYFGIFDMGLARAVNNAISQKLNDSNEIKCKIIISALVTTFVIGVLVSIFSGSALYFWINSSGSHVYKGLLPAIPAMMIGIPILTMTSTLNGALDGERKFHLSNFIQVFGALLYQGFPLIFAKYFAKDISALIIVVIAARFLMLLMYLLAVVKIFSINRHIEFSLKESKVLLKFGWSVSVINTLDPLVNRIDQFFVGRLCGLSGIASYSVAMNSVNRLNILPLAISRTLFPDLSSRKFSDYRSEIFELKKRMLLPWFAVCALSILASDFAFNLWLGTSIGKPVSLIAKVLIIGLWANCLAFLPYTTLQAAGRSKSIIAAHLLEIPVFIIALYFLTSYFGPQGAALAWTLRVGLDYIILWKLCHFNIRDQLLYIFLFSGLFVVNWITIALHF